MLGEDKNLRLKVILSCEANLACDTHMNPAMHATGLPTTCAGLRNAPSQAT